MKNQVTLDPQTKALGEYFEKTPNASLQIIEEHFKRSTTWVSNRLTDYYKYKRTLKNI